MGKQLARVTDAEDLAQAAFLTLWECSQTERKQTLHLDDRQDLLALLAKITIQKVRRALRDCTRQKRDIRRTLRASDVSSEQEALAELAGYEPPPDWSPIFNETVDAWLADLRPLQQEIVRKRLQGYEQREIGCLLGCSLRAIEREISAVKSAWRKLGHTNLTGGQAF